MRRFSLIFLISLVWVGVSRMDSPGVPSDVAERNMREERWERLVAALSYVESRDDDAAVNPISGATGRWQMTRIYVDEVNRILSLSGDERRFRYDDRKDPARARRMFDIFQSFHNPDKDIELAIRLHRGIGSPSYRREVLKMMNEFNQ